MDRDELYRDYLEMRLNPDSETAFEFYQQSIREVYIAALREAAKLECDFCNVDDPAQLAFMPVGLDRIQVYTHRVGSGDPWEVCRANNIRARIAELEAGK